jgi:hypothetical protein
VKNRAGKEEESKEKTKKERGPDLDSRCVDDRLSPYWWWSVASGTDAAAVTTRVLMKEKICCFHTSTGI